MFSLRNGGVALITGASGAIGSACASLLHQMGAHVILSGTNYEKLEILGKKLGSNWSIKVCDLSNHTECNEVLKDIPALDVLVCNAGITEDGLGIRMQNDSFKRVIDVNLTANFILNREALKIMFSGLRSL